MKIIYATKPMTQKALSGVIDWAIKNKVHPDWFSVAGIVCAAAAGLGIYFVQVNPYFLLLTVIFAPLRLLLNVCDGQVARGLGVADAWGEVKNEFGDRIADALVFISLAFVPGVSPILLAVCFWLVFLTSYLGILSKAVGSARLYSGVMGKGDRMMWLAFASLLSIYAGTSWLVYVVYLMTAGAGVSIIMRGSELYRSTHE